jgi:hypothetical protein
MVEESKKEQSFVPVEDDSVYGVVRGDKKFHTRNL